MAKPATSKLPVGLDIERVLDAALEHGEQSEPDHEVGDLQEVVRALWGAMSDAQRAQVWQAEQWDAFIEEWS